MFGKSVKCKWPRCASHSLCTSLVGLFICPMNMQSEFGSHVVCYHDIMVGVALRKIRLQLLIIFIQVSILSI